MLILSMLQFLPVVERATSLLADIADIPEANRTAVRHHLLVGFVFMDRVHRTLVELGDATGVELAPGRVVDPVFGAWRNDYLRTCRVCVCVCAAMCTCERKGERERPHNHSAIAKEMGKGRETESI